MAVTMSRSDDTLTVTVTQDVNDLVSNTTATRNDKIVTALNRCMGQLHKAVQAQPGTTELDVRIASLQAERAALPSPILSF